jgi:hypothetical protein
MVLWRDLTRGGPETNMSQPGIDPGLRGGRRALAKCYSNRFNCYSRQYTKLTHDPQKCLVIFCIGVKKCVNLH